MNNSAFIQMRSGPILQALLVAAISISSAKAMAASTSESQPDVLGLSKAIDGEHVIFRVVIRRPEDLSIMTVERSPWRTRQIVWPRIASLNGSPQWMYPCYLEYAWPEDRRPVPRLDRLTFIGRVPNVTPLKLSLRFPVPTGSWKEVPIELNLNTAETLSGDPPPRQRWAAAQAEWFRLLGEHAGDTGGFWTYAAQQTRRKFDLPVSDAPEQPFRQFRSPRELQYNVLSGALAIQESMQLDRMLNTSRDREERSIAFSDIPAVDVKSHPFDEMRGDKEPVQGKLAAFVPEQHYFLRFRNVARFLELLDISEQWGGSLLRLASPVGTDHGTRARTLRQLCLPDNILARMLGPAVIKEIAVSGSDPYMVNGSDVTVLFHVLERKAFQAAVDIPFQQAKQTHDDAQHDEVTYQGVMIDRLVDSRRRISCHRCWIGDVCVYSNSLVALERIIDTAKGTVPSLAQAADFRYMRAAVFPLDDTAEDGFLFLSDSFIRRLVGPEVRIYGRFFAFPFHDTLTTVIIMKVMKRKAEHVTIEPHGAGHVTDIEEQLDLTREAPMCLFVVLALCGSAPGEMRRRETVQYGCRRGDRN